MTRSTGDRRTDVLYVISVIIGFAQLSPYIAQYNSYSHGFNPSPQRPNPIWFREADEISCPRPTGQFDHPRYCDLFINCWQGSPTVDKCQTSLVFNEKIAGCDYPRNVDCRGRVNSQTPSMLDPRCRDPFGTYPNYHNCSEYVVCHSGVGKVIACPENTYYNSVLGVCTYEKDPACIDDDEELCTDPHTPGCPPQPAGSPTQKPSPPSPTAQFKPKPPFQPNPPTPNPSQPQFEQPGSTPMKPSPPAPQTTQPQEISTVNLRPKPPLKPQHPAPATEESPPQIPSEIPEIPSPETPDKPPGSSKPPPLKPGQFKPVYPGGPSNVGPTTTKPPPTDGEDDPNVLFPFLPSYPGSFKCPVTSGMLPVVGDCESVVACVNEVGHLLRCPAGYHFDIVKGRCSTQKSSLCQYSFISSKRQDPKVLYVSIPASQLYEELSV